MRSGWIRPEDVHYYEESGIDMIKLVNRGMDTPSIRKIVEAYTTGSYEGNLLDLFPDPSKNIMCKRSTAFHKIAYFFRPFSVNLFKLLKMKPLIVAKPPFYIDNKELDGFIEHFLRENCRDKLCDECKYCDKATKKLLKYDIEDYEELSSHYNKCLGDIISGDIFIYSNDKNFTELDDKDKA